jgi:hypothetical protein
MWCNKLGLKDGNRWSGLEMNKSISIFVLVFVSVTGMAREQAQPDNFYIDDMCKSLLSSPAIDPIRHKYVPPESNDGKYTSRQLADDTRPTNIERKALKALSDAELTCQTLTESYARENSTPEVVALFSQSWIESAVADFDLYSRGISFGEAAKRRAKIDQTLMSGLTVKIEAQETSRQHQKELSEQRIQQTQDNEKQRELFELGLRLLGRGQGQGQNTPAQRIPSPGVSRKTEGVCVKYQTKSGWSKGYSVQGSIISGSDLNTAVSSYTKYKSYSTYVVVFWAQDQASTYELPASSFGSLPIYETAVRDQYDRAWTIQKNNGYCR